jgi:acyl CoA:acetate/3-ketoacid CoA transferase beta subunit
MTASATPTEICVAACAEAWRPDRELLAQAFGTIPRLGLGLARSTTNPDLLITDGAAMLVEEPLPLGADPATARVEGWVPFRRVFDVVWSGRRHVMMGTTQIDRHGNTNISVIGDWHRPKAQLLGSRGAPGNTVNHAVSYWVPNHGPRVFREQVDMVSGIGTDADATCSRFVDLRRVVSNLAVFDFGGAGGAMRLVSVHPWSTAAEVEEATGFELEIPDRAATTPSPDDAALAVIREQLDPDGLAREEIKV